MRRLTIKPVSRSWLNEEMRSQQKYVPGEMLLYQVNQVPVLVTSQLSEPLAATPEVEGQPRMHIAMLPGWKNLGHK